MQFSFRGLLAAGILFYSTLSFAQHTLQGTVTDPVNNPIPGALIVVNDSLRVASEQDGSYVLPNIQPKKATLMARHAGYQTFTQSINLTDSVTTFNIVLRYLELKTVEITERARTDNLQKLSSKDIGNVPTASGDFIQNVLGAQAGVAINNELTASYSVRGGSYDENLVYVNGIQVYRPFLVRAGQQEGLSFVNSALVDNIQFSAGGFAARYGDKMSSVLDITYKKPDSLEGEVSLGLMGTNLALGNASKNGKWTYIGGVRFQSNALLLGSLETKGEYQPQFWDAQTYITHKISDKTELSLLGVYSSNRFRFVPTTRTTEFGGFAQTLRFTVFFDGKEESKQQSGTAALNLTHRFTDKLRTETTVSHYATYQQENFDIVGQYRLDETNRDFGSDDFGDVVRNLGVGGFLNHARNYIIGNVTNFQSRLFWQTGLHYIRAGATYSLENFDEQWREYQYIDSADYSLPRNPNTVEVFDNIRAENRVNTQRLQLFVEDEVRLDFDNETAIAFNAGVRAHYYQYTDQWVGGPRASIAYYPNKKVPLNDSITVKRDIVWRLSGGMYYQPPLYRELRGIQGNLVPDIEAQRSIHAVLSLNYGLFMWNRPFKLISELYYKTYDNLIPYELENVRIRYYGENSAVGFARGFDMKLHGEFVKGLESWVSIGLLDTQEDILNDVERIFLNTDGDTIYSFTRNREVDSVITNQPGFIPRPTDQRFRFGLHFKDEMPGFEDFTVQLSFLYGTPLPFGPPDFNRFRDTLRTTSYKRVDIGFSKEFIDPTKPPKGFLGHFKSLKFSVLVLNVLDAQNIVNSTWIRDVSGGQYGVPNYLTRRLVNLQLTGTF